MSACNPTILTRIGDSGSFTKWKTTTDAALNMISATAVAGTTTPTTKEESILIAAEKDIINTLVCMQQQISKLKSTTNNIQDAQQEVISINEQIKNEEANADIARDRVAYIRNPEQHTSFYESWFPMDRPMRLGSVPIFIGVSAFLFIFIILIILAAMGANITFQLPPASTTPNPLFEILRNVSTLEWILMGVLIIFVIYFVNRK